MTSIAIGNRRSHDPHLDDPAHGDITLIVNDAQRYHAHRALLSLWSPVFARMLHNGMKESSDAVINLQEDPLYADMFGQLLSHLYPYSRVVVDNSNVSSFLYFIDKYNLPEKIKEDCEDYLLTIRPRSWSLLILAQHHSLPRLLSRHVVWASARLDSGLGRLRSEHLDQLEASTLVKILLHTAKRVGSVREMVRRMSMATNCNICQIMPVTTCPTYCSHSTQFLCLLKMLDDC